MSLLLQFFKRLKAVTLSVVATWTGQEVRPTSDVGFANSKPANGTSLISTHTLRSGLISAIPFYEGTGTTVNDKATGGTGTLSGSSVPTWTSNSYDSGVLIGTGVDQVSYVNMGTPAALTDLWRGTSGTVFIRARRTSLTNAGIVGKNDNNASTRGWQISQIATDKFELVLEATANLYTTIPAVITAGQDFTLAFTHDGVLAGTNVKGYVNGVSQTVTIVGVGSGTRTSDSADTLKIGTTTGFTASGCWNQAIYEVLIWNRILSQSEITMLHNDPYCVFRSWEPSTSGAALYTQIDEIKSPKVLRSEPFDKTAGEIESTWTHQRTSTGNRINYDGFGNAKSAVENSDTFAFDNTMLYPPDQFARVQIGGGLASATDWVRATTRASGSLDSTYQCYYAITDGLSGATHTEFGKVVADVTTVFRNFTAVFTTGDWIELQSVGTVHEVFKVTLAGVRTSLGTYTDASITTGSAGFGIYDSTSNAINPLVSTWEGGEIAPLPDDTDYIHSNSTAASAEVLLGTLTSPQAGPLSIFVRAKTV